MADNLPLIPGKDGMVCADVRPVLREVFRELNLPPLVTVAAARDQSSEDENAIPTLENWLEKYKSNCDEIWHREGELKLQYAKRLSKKPLRNIYKLHSLASFTENLESWKKDLGIIDRKDLIPSIEQDARRDGSLWVKNILNKSSCNVSEVQVQDPPLQLPHRLMTFDEYSSLKTLSMGEVLPRPVSIKSPRPPSEPAPECIICIPSQLNFVNFAVGQLYTQPLRLVNLSKFEIRLSIRPPSRRELNVELCGSRGLIVTCGAAAELKIHFKPRDVRALRDEMLVRVSMGKDLLVPIACYMQPPILDILVPNVNKSVLSCTPGDEGWDATAGGNDVLDLGARLLGDVHYARLMLHCNATHAAFFLLTEDAWLSFSIDELTNHGTLIADPFIVTPAWWAGGGSVRGAVWCRATCPGLHIVALRVLSSTAVVRPLSIIADSLFFKPSHLTIEAHEKDYDICSDDDPACQYYVHLGTAFPHRSLSATVQLLNHSPVIYTYYWSVRPWRVCSCKDELITDASMGTESISENLCIGAKEALVDDKEWQGSRESLERCARAVRVEPSSGFLAARASVTAHVCVPHAGEGLGTHRAVLMLILKDIPKESFSADYNPMVVSTESVETDRIPGVQGSTRELCDVVCAQMEVWWEVAPIRFVLDPVALKLPYSRRVNFVNLLMRATQLFGSDDIRAWWSLPPNVTPPPPPHLTPSESWKATMRLPLAGLPDASPKVDVITLVADNQEWQYNCEITRWCATRHPRLRETRAWLGVVPPGKKMSTQFLVENDTFQHISWNAVGYRWCGENPPSRLCEGREPCTDCLELACTCAILRPTQGAMPHARRNVIKYEVHAPNRDGCVATLVQMRRTDENVERSVAGSAARASLVCYRVLAPRIVLRLLPCGGNKRRECEDCALDEGALSSAGGTGVLRPSNELVLGHHSCYHLRYTNITPTSTTIKWEPAIQDEDTLKVEFHPNELHVGPYEEIETQVSLVALKVTPDRRLFLRRAQVARAYKPLYLVIDAAIAGLEVICEVPLGGGEQKDGFICLRRMQKAEQPRADLEPTTRDEIFAEDDRKRAIQRDPICKCKFELVYIPPPVKRPQTPPKDPDDSDQYPPVEILDEPPLLSRVCSCCKIMKPVMCDDAEPYCLQFIGVPLKTVRTRSVKLRNVSMLTARWTAHIRRWPRVRTRTLTTDPWSTDVHDPGVATQCAPARGVLCPRAEVDINVRVYADCWGLYSDQLLIKIEKLEPIIVDIWIEVIGPPLQFALSPTDTSRDIAPIFWMSSSDTDRTLHVKNTSRSDLKVHAYVLKEHDYEQDRLPFRIYIRFFETLPRVCSCLYTFSSKSIIEEGSVENSSCVSIVEEMDLGMELYLGPDHGTQEDTHFLVEPGETTVSAGTSADWKIKLAPPDHGELAPSCALLIRTMPTEQTKCGPFWFRREPLPQTVKLRHAPREGVLKLSCQELKIKLCALDLPCADVLRVRKHIHVQNVGNGHLNIVAHAELPWSVVVWESGGICSSGCGCGQVIGTREPAVMMHIEPRSSNELVVEVCVNTMEAWPTEDIHPFQKPVYNEWRTSYNYLYICDKDNILRRVPLILELEYPIINVEPTFINFKFVTDGDTRKIYFTVSHSSKTETLQLATQWIGAKEFQLWPKQVEIAPGCRERVYLQYNARYSGAPVEGYARVFAMCGAGCFIRTSIHPKEQKRWTGWCYAIVPVRATPTLDHMWQQPVHDHTDDEHLLPPGLPF